MENTVLGYNPKGFLYLVGRDNQVISVQVNHSSSQITNDWCHLPKFNSEGDAIAHLGK